jgi:hypothetical protein
MIAAPPPAVAVTAPSAGVGIGGPFCIGSAVQPGHSYPLNAGVADTGSGGETITVTVVPDPEKPAGTLRQVPASWLSPASADAAAGQGVNVPVTLTIPPGAAPGPYWSWMLAGTGPQRAAGPGVTATFGASAADILVFTVGPSRVPPPPCAALTLAESTGQYPAWPTAAFATTSWKQVFARDDEGPGAQHLPSASVSAKPSQAATLASASGSYPAMPGWAVLAVVAAIIVLVARGRRAP